MITGRAFGFILLLIFSLTASASTASIRSGNYLNVAGTKIWYEECGAVGATSHSVILLHDGLMDSTTWDDIWPPLCADYHVVRYDRRGYGRSDPARSSFRPEEDLAKIMALLRIKRAIIIGNSSGGGMALDFALAHPHLVEALLLIGPVVHGMPSSDYFNERGNRNNAPMAEGNLNATADNWSKDRFLISGDDPIARKKIYDALARNPQNLRVAGGLERRPSPPTVTRLREIEVPTLILVGDADIGDVFMYSGAIQASVRLASFEIWKDAGHLIQIQSPTRLVTRLKNFVALVERHDVHVAPRRLANLVGRYKLSNESVRVFQKKGDLVLEIPGQPYYWLFAASDTKFFLRTENTEITFRVDSHGRASEMTIHNSDGSESRCPRLSSDRDR